ncbi:MAG: prepilin-type N-terminal cleavage/methylation domain-containing protein [Pseudomonadota bacterium]
MKKKGFTLVELMIVVAIIGILAAIAIPSFMAYIKKSKKSEVGMLVNGIFAAEADYNIDNARFHHIPTSVPTDNVAVLNGDKQPNSQAAFAGDTNGFKIIGYVPDGDIYSGTNCNCTMGGDDVTTGCSIIVYQDLDDDGTRGMYDQAIKRDKAGSGDAYKMGSINTAPLED